MVPLLALATWWLWGSPTGRADQPPRSGQSPSPAATDRSTGPFANLNLVTGSALTPSDIYLALESGQVLDYHIDGGVFSEVAVVPGGLIGDLGVRHSADSSFIVGLTTNPPDAGGAAAALRRVRIADGAIDTVALDLTGVVGGTIIGEKDLVVVSFGVGIMSIDDSNGSIRRPLLESEQPYWYLAASSDGGLWAATEGAPGQVARVAADGAVTIEVEIPATSIFGIVTLGDGSALVRADDALWLIDAAGPVRIPDVGGTQSIRSCGGRGVFADAEGVGLLDGQQAPIRLARGDALLLACDEARAYVSFDGLSIETVSLQR